MSGNSAGTFGPNSVLTRAMVAQIFYNLEGKPEVANTADFTDVSGHWAQNAISWIQQSGVVAGYEDNTLRPGGNTTRAEGASIIMGLAQTLSE